MNVKLVVAQGPHKGKEILIKVAQFVIGRDPQCQLRPASPMISRRHCALVTRDSKIILEDFGSTNGTQVNDQRVKGEIELHHGDTIKIDPLYFEVQIEGLAPAKAAPKPAHEHAEDDSIAAAMLLDIPDTDTAPSAGMTGTNPEVPLGDTVMQYPANPQPEPETPTVTPEIAKKDEKKKAELGNTSNAAKLLLEKYTKRKHT
jgi:pSer/pThr/pTyr-binding forkhead associated (FHA) protein